MKTMTISIINQAINIKKDGSAAWHHAMMETKVRDGEMKP